MTTAQPFVVILASNSPAVDESLALKFASSYTIALVCSHEYNAKSITQSVESANGSLDVARADLSSRDSIAEAISSIKERLGDNCGAAIYQQPHNTDSPASFLEQTTKHLQDEAMAPITLSYDFAKSVLPALQSGKALSGHPPTLLFVGPYTSSYYRDINENALVALSRSLGREFGPKGVHICHVKFKQDIPNSDEQGSAAEIYSKIADTAWNLHVQPLSCFSNEMTI